MLAEQKRVEAEIEEANHNNQPGGTVPEQRYKKG